MGLIIRRHDEVIEEWGQLCKLGYARVGREPVIKVGDSSKPEGHRDRDGRRGDMLVRGVHALQKDCIYDFLVINQDAVSRSKVPVAKVLSQGERGKNSKHKSACDDRRADFVPVVVTTDGCMGEQAQKSLKKLGRRLAEKWEKTYSEVVGVLFSRMSIVIMRATSMCIRASRDPIQSRCCCMEDGAALEIMLG